MFTYPISLHTMCVRLSINRLDEKVSALDKISGHLWAVEGKGLKLNQCLCWLMSTGCGQWKGRGLS